MGPSRCVRVRSPRARDRRRLTRLRRMWAPHRRRWDSSLRPRTRLGLPGRRPRACGFRAASSRWARSDPPDMPTRSACRRRRDSRPIHRVYVDGFWMDATEVTNAQFAEFVEGDRLRHRRRADAARGRFPGAPPENLVAGSVVFTPPDACRAARRPFPMVVRTSDGANWRHPLGPESSIAGQGAYPVVHVAYEDARRLREVGRQAPADRGGVGVRGARRPDAGKLYPWGDEFKPDGKWMANIYQGQFPDRGRSGEDGFTGIAPVAQFPPNGYGLYDVAGNVWEWVQRLVSPRLLRAAGGGRRRRAQSAGPADVVRSRRARREEARASRRLVPLHRPVLHALHGRHARQGRGQHRHQPPRLPLREIALKRPRRLMPA